MECGRDPESDAFLGDARLLCWPILAQKLSKDFAKPYLDCMVVLDLHPTFSPSSLHPGSDFHHGLMAGPAFLGFFPISFHTGSNTNTILPCLIPSGHPLLRRHRLAQLFSFSHTSHPLSKLCQLSSNYKQGPASFTLVQVIIVSLSRIMAAASCLHWHGALKMAINSLCSFLPPRIWRWPLTVLANCT